jgi:prepilin-type processing-associated H-X9-DG protein
MTDDDTRNFGWGTYILPFMEQQPLYDQIGAVCAAQSPPQRLFPKGESGHVNVDTWGTLRIDHTNSSGPQQIDNTRRVLESYLCPSNPLQKVDNNGYGASSYVASAGVRPQLLNSSYSYGCANWKGKDQRGAIVWDNDNNNTWTTNMASMVDGTSNTFLVGEIGLARNRITSAKSDNGNYPLWAGGNNDGGCNTQWMGSHLRFTDDVHFLNRADDTHEATLSFGSLHPGGAMFVLCDGSVRFVNETIDTLTYGYIGMRDDGNPAQLP